MNEPCPDPEGGANTYSKYRIIETDINVELIVWFSLPGKKKIKIEKSFIASDLSHGGVISLVGIQFVLNQLSQGGIVFVLTDRMTENKGMCNETRKRNKKANESLLIELVVFSLSLSIIPPISYITYNRAILPLHIYVDEKHNKHCKQ